MPDWQALVRQRLAGLAFEDAEKDEVHAELAGHLEETYEALFKEGVDEPTAVRRALSEVSNWQDLQQRIYSARNGKDSMTNRVTQLWLPGLLSFGLSMVLLELAQKFGPRPIILDLDKGTPILMFYISWLLILPLAGAMGAFLSRRNGGSVRMVLVSSIFPVLPFAVVFMIAIPIGLMINHSLAHHIVTAAYFSLSVGWVLAPGIALFVGGLLIQLLNSRRPASRG